MQPFVKWAPDQYDLDSEFASEALGVLVGARSFQPWPSLAAATDVLPVVRDITDVSQANPGVVTYSGSDEFADDDVVRISGVVGMTELNGNDYTVASLDTGANTFELSGTNTSGFTAYSSGGKVTAPNTSSVTCRGSFAAKTSGGSTVIFAGSADKLFKYSASSHPSFVDVTRTSVGAYSLGAGDYWSFCQFDNLLIACNGVDAVQVINIDSGTAFAALGGSPPIAKYCKVVGDVVLLMDLASGQGPVASSGRIQAAWSGFRDPDYWTFGKKSSNFATFWNVGFVQGATNILAGLLFTQKSIQRMVQTTSANLLAFAPITEEVGTEAAYSIITRGNAAYLYSTQGFISVAGGMITPIGNEWVDRWFLEAVDGGRVGSICGSFDPIKRRVFWGFHSPGNDTNYFDQIIAYDITLDQWTHAATDASYIFGAASPGQTLADLAANYSTLSGVPYPLGSRVWQGGAPSLSAFDSNDKLAFFSGPSLGATVQTSLFQPIPGRRGFVNGFRPRTDAANVTGRIAVTERPQTTPTWLASQSATAQGLIPARASGRQMRIECSIASGEEWTSIQGVDFGDGDLQPDGEN